MTVKKFWLILIFLALFILYDKYRYREFSKETNLSQTMLFGKTVQYDLPFSNHEYLKRQQSLFRILQHDLEERNGNVSCDIKLVILLANKKQLMTHDISYEFHQNSDVSYLTGYQVPNDVIILQKGKLQKIIFTSQKDKKNNSYSIIYPMHSLESFLTTEYSNISLCLWYKENKDYETDNKTKSIVNFFMDGPKKRAFDIGYQIDMLRLIKSPSEVHLITRASEKLAGIFKNIMEITMKQNKKFTGRAIVLFFEYECKRTGGRFVSFAPVITNGKQKFSNAHTSMNVNSILREKDWVLLDAGCEYNGYSTDLTRTWPLSHDFKSDPYWDVYQVVLKVFKDLSLKCASGISLLDLNDFMINSFTQHLTSLGLLREDLTEDEKIDETKKYCPHFVGHFIGLDVHDTPSIHSGIPLQVGMVFTIEPGIYIPLGTNLPETKYKGISVRIEDMILMTDNGPKSLTTAAPKEF